MDSWQIVLGGVTVGLVALYFTPTLDSYIKSLTASPEERERIERLKKARFSQGLWQLISKDDIFEYVMNHPSMSPVSSLLKTCGNSSLSPLTPATAMSPGSPVATPKPPSASQSPHSANTYQDIEIDSKFLPTREQFELVIQDLSSHLQIRPEFNESLPLLLSGFGGNTPATLSQNKAVDALPTTFSQLLSTSILTHHAINLSTPGETTEQLQKLYLLALRQDSHPDYKLQAYYDLFTTSTALRSTTSPPQPVSQQTITQSTHNALPKQEKITWTPSQEGQNGIQSEDFSTMSNRAQTAGPSNPDPFISLDNLTTIVPNSDLIDGTGSTGNDLNAFDNEITYPSIYSGITSLYQISTFAALLQSVRKIKVEHSVPWHEKCLEILWTLAPIYQSASKSPKNTPSQAETPTTPSSSDQELSCELVHVEYKQMNEKWGDIGFQGRDPCTDFRGCGLLGLICLVSFAITQPDAYVKYIKAHQEKGIGIYGLAITCINITATLVDYTQNHVLTPIYLQQLEARGSRDAQKGISAVFFGTFVKLHGYLLKMLFEEWIKREQNFNVSLSFSSEQKHRVLGSSPASRLGAASPLGRGLTVMDFPMVFKEVLVLFKKQIFQQQIHFD